MIPDGVKIGKNTAISGVTYEQDYTEGELKAGEYIIKAGDDNESIRVNFSRRKQ